MSHSINLNRSELKAPQHTKDVKRRTPGVQLLIRIPLLSHGKWKESFYVTYDLVDEVFAVIL